MIHSQGPNHIRLPGPGGHLLQFGQTPLLEGPVDGRGDEMPSVARQGHGNDPGLMGKAGRDHRV